MTEHTQDARTHTQDTQPEQRRPVRGDRFEHRHWVDPDVPPKEAGPLVCVVTATRIYPEGVTVFYCAASSWDHGHRRGRFHFEGARQGESVLRWLP